VASDHTANPNDEGISGQIQTMSLRQGSPLITQGVNQTKPVQADQAIYHSASLTTAALSRLHQFLFSEVMLKSDGTYGIDQSLKDVPIECVRFFRYLNETAQRYEVICISFSLSLIFIF
jgi:hypothetical protein